jgi:uncharacterized protein YjdB
VSSSGVVTPKSAGTATITAESVDGNKTAICVVTVAALIVNPIIGSWEITKIEMRGDVTIKRVTNGVESTTVTHDSTIEMFTNERVSTYKTDGWRMDRYVFNITDSAQYVYQAADSSVITTLREGNVENATFSLSGNEGTLVTVDIVDTLSSGTDGTPLNANYHIFTGIRIESMTKQ